MIESFSYQESTMNIKEMTKEVTAVTGWMKIVGVTAILGSLIIIIITLGFGLIVFGFTCAWGVQVMKIAKGFDKISQAQNDVDAAICFHEILTSLKSSFVMLGLGMVIGIIVLVGGFILSLY